MIKCQQGQALPIAILALAIGSLVIAPFLGYAGSSLIGSRAYGDSIQQQSACDAGVEHAIWSLTWGDLAGKFTEPGEEVSYQLDEKINGLATSVTITANETGGGGFGGDITEPAIDYLEFDTSNGREPSIVQVTNNIYAVAYRGSNNRGYLKTMTIDADGDIGNNVIDTMQFDNTCYEPCVVRISEKYVAIAYRGPSNRGYLKTATISSSGAIGNSVIDTLQFDTACYEPRIKPITGDCYAIVYRGSHNRGYVITASISSTGVIGNHIVDELQFDDTCYEPSMVFVGGDYYAIAYRGSGSSGYLTTVMVYSSGDIYNWVIDSEVFEYWTAYDPCIINVSDNTFAIAYSGFFSMGYLQTVSISAKGTINATIDSYMFDYYGYEPRIIKVSGEIFAVAYRGSSNRGDLITISITAAGDIGSSTLDSMEFDSSACYEPDVIQVSSNIFAIAHRGKSNDGYVHTVEISIGGGIAAYTIRATAGDRTIRAYVNIEKTTANIIYWQIQ